MGIVRKQSIIGSIFVYAGAGLGFVISALLFPKFLTSAQIGLISILITYSILFSQLASAGFLNTITRMFPYFRNEEKKHNGFLFLTLTVVAIASILMSGVYYVIEPYILQNSSNENTLFSDYAHLIVPLFIFIVFFNIFDSYTKALFNATRGILLKELVLRILILGVFVLYYFDLINFSQFILLYVLSYGAIMLYLMLKLIAEKQFSLQPNKELLNKPMIKEITSVSLYGLFISAAGFIAINIDRIMIEKLVAEDPLSQVGIYATCTFFATMIILPSRPLMKITSTIIAEAWKDKDMDELQNVYTKSTITQLIIGTLVFIGIWINIDNIFEIIPEEYKAGKWVILFIGLFYLSDMASGANNNIIGNSPEYRKLSLITVVLIILIITLNFVFIPKFGISGAAFASFLAKFIFNFMSYLFTRTKYKLQPYNIQHVKIIAIGVIAYYATFLLPNMNNLYIDIVLKSGLISILFCVLIYITKVSEDVNEMVDKLVKR